MLLTLSFEVSVVARYIFHPLDKGERGGFFYLIFYVILNLIEDPIDTPKKLKLEPPLKWDTPFSKELHNTICYSTPRAQQNLQTYRNN